MNKTNNPCQDSANKSDSLIQIQLSTTQLNKITTFKGKKKPRWEKPLLIHLNSKFKLIHNQETTDQGPPDKHIYKENNQNPEI
jgi:hypothetical protein